MVRRITRYLPKEEEEAIQIGVQVKQLEELHEY